MKQIRVKDSKCSGYQKLILGSVWFLFCCLSMPIQAQTSVASEANEIAPESKKNVVSKKQVAKNAQAVMRLDETVISGNQELPKVLYILPWREPEGLPEIEIQTEFSEAEIFRRLYPPAYRRELSYFDALQKLSDQTELDQEK